MFAPHHTEDAQFYDVWFTPQNLFDILEFVRGNAVFGDYLICNLDHYLSLFSLISLFLMRCISIFSRSSIIL